MEISGVVANILEMAKVDGKHDKCATVVFDNFKDLVTDTSGDADQYEKIATACIVGAGIKRGLWSASGWTAAPRDGVLCWTKEGYEPVAITLRAKKLVDGTEVVNNTSTDRTHKSCVAYMGAVKKYLTTGGVIGDLPSMTWNQLTDRNSKFEKDGSVKPDKLPKTPNQIVDEAVGKIEQHSLNLSVSDKALYMARLGIALS